MISLQSLKLLAAILGRQQIAVSADDEEISAVLTAKRELSDAIRDAEQGVTAPTSNE